MPQKIKFRANNVQVSAELNDGPTAKAIINILPIEAFAQRWGGEIYFSVSAKGTLEAGGRDVLEAGKLGYGLLEVLSAYSSVAHHRRTVIR